MKTSQPVAVIIPNWNGAKRLRGCVPSLLKQSYENFTIIVVDNGSKEDDSVELLERLTGKHKSVVTLRNAENGGFTGGVNPGIRWALMHGFDAIALLNNDAVVDKDWLKELVRVLETKSDVGIATGLLLHADGKTIDSTGDWLSTWGLSFPRNRNDPVHKAPDEGYVFSASGGASLYRSSLLKTIGIFDERYFAYYEDVDISFRAQLSGSKVFYNPKAVAYHGQGETSRSMPGFTVQQTFRNLPILLFKNLPASLFWPVLPKFCLAYVLFLGNAVRHGQARPAFKGYTQSIPLVFGVLLKARRDIRRQRSVSVKSIRQSLWPDLPPEQTGLRKFRAFFIRSKA